ncbi:MAG: flippase [bacterium]|nr:flippase [bacterium]
MKHTQSAIAKNYLLQFASRVIAVTLGLFTLAIMTRALGDTGFGEYTTAVTYLQVVAVLVDLGLTLVFIQMIAKPGADEERITSALFGLRLLSGFVVFGIMAGVAFLTPYSLTIKLAIAVGTVSYLSLSATGMLTGIYQKHLRMGRAVVAELTNRVLTLALILIVASQGMGVVAMVGVFSISNLVQLVLLVLLARSMVRVRPIIDTAIWKQALSASWPIGLAIFFNLIYLKSDVLILGFYYPQAEVGIYGAGYRVIDVFTAFPVIYMGLILPQLVRTWGGKLHTEFNEFLQKTFDFFAVFVLPLVFGTPLVAVPLMSLIAGPDFARSGHVLPILMIAMIPIFMGAMTGHAIIALNKQRVMLWGYVLTAIVALTGYFLLIPPFGIVGAAWMTVASEILINTLTAIVVFRTARYMPKLVVFSKALVASIIMYLTLSILPEFHVLITVLLGALVYIAAIVALGGVRLSSIKELLVEKANI